MGHTGIVAAIYALKRGAGDVLRDVALAKSTAAIREREELQKVKMYGDRLQIEHQEYKAIDAEHQAAAAAQALTVKVPQNFVPLPSMVPRRLIVIVVFSALEDVL